MKKTQAYIKNFKVWSGYEVLNFTAPENYTSRLIRKEMRLAVNKKDEFIYKCAKLAKICVQYEPVWGISSVWDFSKNGWAHCEELNVFNTACQHAANMVGCKPQDFVKLTYLVLSMGIDENEEKFFMPSTKTVMNKIKERIR